MSAVLVRVERVRRASGDGSPGSFGNRPLTPPRRAGAVDWSRRRGKREGVEGEGRFEEVEWSPADGDC